MEFITCFLRTSKKHDSIMVLVNKMSKVAHLIVVNFANLASEVSHIFIKE